MKTANLVYFGTPDFSAKILQSLLSSPTVRIVGVVTTPDQSRGRRQAPTPSPVGLVAAEANLPLYKPAILDTAHLAHLKLLKPDLFLVISYGKIIPASWLTIPAIATLNLHFSLLPKYRGALGISQAIKNGDSQTGVTLMVMDEQLDHGPLIAQERVNIDINDNVADLTTKLTQVGIKLLSDFLPRVIQRKYTAAAQNETEATLTPSTKTRTRDSAYLPWNSLRSAMAGKDAPQTHALIRSLNPDPGAWTCLPAGTAKIGPLEIKILKTSLVDHHLELNLVQLPSKKPITWTQFLSGHPTIL